jgi:hypothetical protein
MLTLTAAAELTRVGREMKMLVDGQDDHAAVDPSLLRIIARAHNIRARLLRDLKKGKPGAARRLIMSAIGHKRTCKAYRPDDDIARFRIIFVSFPGPSLPSRQ